LAPSDSAHLAAYGGARVALADKSESAAASAAAAMAAPEPNPIPLFAQIIVGIAFEVYNRHQDRKAADRARFAADMKEAISWKQWPDIKPDDSIAPLPAPKPSTTPQATPTPKP